MTDTTQSVAQPIDRPTQEKLNDELIELLKKSAQPVRNTFYRTADYQTLLRSKHITRMLQLVNSGADVNTAGPGGVTLLMRAAEFGKKDYIEQVLAHAPRVDQIDLSGKTALHYAATFNREKAAEILLNAGANPVAVDHNAMSPLACAYSELKNHDRTIEVLLKARRVEIVHGHLYPSTVDDLYFKDGIVSDRVRAALKERVEKLQKFKTDQLSLEVQRSYLVQRYNRTEEDK